MLDSKRLGFKRLGALKGCTVNGAALVLCLGATLLLLKSK